MVYAWQSEPQSNHKVRMNDADNILTTKLLRIECKLYSFFIPPIFLPSFLMMLESSEVFSDRILLTDVQFLDAELTNPPLMFEIAHIDSLRPCFVFLLNRQRLHLKQHSCDPCASVGYLVPNFFQMTWYRDRFVHHNVPLCS